MTSCWQFLASRLEHQQLEGMLSFMELSGWCWENVAVYGWATELNWLNQRVMFLGKESESTTAQAKASSNISTYKSHMFMPKIPVELKSLWYSATCLCLYFTFSGHWDDRYSYVVLNSAVDMQTFKKAFSCLGKIPDELSAMACKFRVSFAKIGLCWWLRL